jgi:hypothetical protein
VTPDERHAQLDTGFDGGFGCGDALEAAAAREEDKSDDRD